jgi:hypothetical protein
MQIRIEASDLPGRNFPGASNIYVAVQRRARREELLDPYPGDATSATWTLECTAVPAQAGADISGPYVQGPPGGRFIYLSWGTVDDAGAFTLFRRAKLWLDAIDPAIIDTAMKSGCLTARLGLTDAKGLPLCAAVRPPLIQWSATSAAG